MVLALQGQSGPPFRGGLRPLVTFGKHPGKPDPRVSFNRTRDMLAREMTRIFLIDDHPLIRKGLRLTLEAENDFMVCGEASSAEEALEILDQATPDVMVLDISLPGMSGLDFLREVHATRSALRTLVVSRHDEILYAERAIRAGAKGYVMKSEAPQALVTAIRKILSGGIHVSPAINERLLQGIAAGQQSFNQSPSEALSGRELEVFEMTGRGLGTREIANRLNLSIKTVESYRARIKMKLNLTNAAELVQHAVQWSESSSTY